MQVKLSEISKFEAGKLGKGNSAFVSSRPINHASMNHYEYWLFSPEYLAIKSRIVRW